MVAWIWGIVAVGAIVLAWLTIRYSLLMPAVRGLPVLMYHQIDPTRADALTVTTDQFAAQLQYLADEGYRSITCRQLADHVAHGTPLPPRPVLLTFDDGYVNNATYAYPLLKRFGFRATIFLPVGHLGGTNRWDGGSEPLLSAEQLAAFDSATIEFGLHSFQHENYERLTAAEVGADVRRCQSALAAAGLNFAPAVAYPYGRYPRQPSAKAAMQTALAAAGVTLGLRIGNRINRLPLKRPFEVRRINIKGTESAWEFRTKVRKGRVKLL